MSSSSNQSGGTSGSSSGGQSGSASGGQGSSSGGQPGSVSGGQGSSSGGQSGSASGGQGSSSGGQPGSVSGGQGSSSGGQTTSASIFPLIVDLAVLAIGGTFVIRSVGYYYPHNCIPFGIPIVWSFVLGYVGVRQIEFGKKAVNVSTKSIVILFMAAACSAPVLFLLDQPDSGVIRQEEVLILRKEVSPIIVGLGSTRTPVDVALAECKADPTIGVAELYLSVCTRVRTLAQKKMPAAPPLGVRETLALLATRGLLSNSDFASIRELVSICDRAIHGSEISESTATILIQDVGQPVLTLLDKTIAN